jgi:hypothetical protein
MTTVYTDKFISFIYSMTRPFWKQPANNVHTNTYLDTRKERQAKPLSNQYQPWKSEASHVKKTYSHATWWQDKLNIAPCQMGYSINKILNVHSINIKNVLCSFHKIWIHKFVHVDEHRRPFTSVCIQLLHNTKPVIQFLSRLKKEEKRL